MNKKIIYFIPIINILTIFYLIFVVFKKYVVEFKEKIIVFLKLFVSTGVATLLINIFNLIRNENINTILMLVSFYIMGIFFSVIIFTFENKLEEKQKIKSVEHKHYYKNK